MPRRLRIGYYKKIFPRPVFEAIAASQLYVDDLPMVMLAYRLGKYGHRGQTRKDFSRYFDHPKAIALIIMLEFGVYKPKPIILGLTHDLMEDSFILAWQDIQLIFGRDIYRGLRIITKEEHKDYFAGLERADWWIILVKLADRLHNLRQLLHTTKKFKKRQLAETDREFPRLLDAFEKKVPAEYSYLPAYIHQEFAYAIQKVKRSL